jgi:glutathione synthase
MDASWKPDTTAAVDLALIHGLLQYGPDGVLGHCPLMLVPTQLERDRLTQLQDLTAPSSLLFHRVAQRLDFLADQLQQTAAADEFTGFLLNLAQATQGDRPDWRLSIMRNDYFVTQPDAAGAVQVRQVEFNPMAASYGGLAGRMAQFQRVWGQACGAAWDVVPQDPAVGMAEAIAAARDRYGVPGAAVLFVVQPQERNVFDQRILEAALRDREIPVIRAGLAELGEAAQLREGHLVLHGHTIAVAYFRAGYRPDEYDHEGARAGLRQIARSSAIAVPDLPTHLAGTKKIQQVLTHPAILRQFLDEADAARLEQAFALIVPLDAEITWRGETLSAQAAAIRYPADFVLKPQREGGGFNLYGEQMRDCLTNLSPSEYPAYILMERIRPAVQPSWALRAGQLWQGDTVSEIGMFGVFLGRKEAVDLNREVGYLVRTKPQDVDEGGISAGYGYLNGLAIA